MLLNDFRFQPALKIVLVGFLAGVSGFMFKPLVVVTPISYFMASFGGVLITVPLILYFLEVPRSSFDFSGYRAERGFEGVVVDVVLTVLLAMAPGVVVLYWLVGAGFLSPVPVASSAAIGVFTGYSAFLYRNKGFYSEPELDIEV